MLWFPALQMLRLFAYHILTEYSAEVLLNTVVLLGIHYIHELFS